MAKLTFDVPYFSIDEPTPELLASYIDDDSPRFCVTMMLAKLNVPNSNGHRLMKDEVEKALKANNDKPVPANLDHETMPWGASTELWIEEKGRTIPELWLSAVYWKRYISAEKRKEIEKSRKNKKLGASWEIDEGHYTLEADKDNSKILDVKDFSIDGFGLMVGKTPAEIKTQGTATITAQLEGSDMNSGDEVVKIDTYGELRLDMLRSVRCPTCGSRGRMRKLNFVDGVFEMECLNGEFDSDKISHIYEVSIAVKPKGQAAEYVLTATKEAAENFKVDDEVIQVELKRTNEEVYDMEFTEDNKREIAAEVDSQVKAFLADQKKTEDDLAKQKADAEVDIEARIKAASEKAGTDAVEAYKKQQEVAAKRFDELSTIMPYESEEAKVLERDKLSAMTDEQYADYKERRELLAKIAELSKEPDAEGDGSEEGGDSEEGDTSNAGEQTAGSDLPGGKIEASKTGEPDFSALGRM